MKILDRYFITEYLKTFFGVLIVFMMVLLLREVLGTLAEILAGTVTTYDIILYFASSMPAQIVQIALPITAILAMMFSIGAMSKRKEVLAVHASGISYLRIALPLAILLAVITIGVSIVSQVLVPRCEEKSRQIKQIEIKGKDQSVITKNKNVTSKGDRNRFYDMKSFDNATNKMELPTFVDYSVTGGDLLERMDAEWAVLTTQRTKDDKQIWRLHNAVRRTFDGEGELVKQERFADLEIALDEGLDRFLSTNRRINEMQYGELNEFVRLHRERQDERYRELLTSQQSRIAFPFSIFLLGMIGYTFAVRSSIRSLVIEFGLALASIIGYYALIGASQVIAQKTQFAVGPMSWLTTIIFAIILIMRFWELERVPRG